MTEIIKGLLAEDVVFFTLKKVFAPSSEILSEHANGYEYFYAKGEKWRIEYRPYRLPYNCAYKAKMGRSIIFEITPKTNGDYVIHSTGEALSHLKLNPRILTQVKTTLHYNAKFGHKHYYTVREADLREVFEAYLDSDYLYDNGLVKPGEIKDLSRPHLKR